MLVYHFHTEWAVDAPVEQVWSVIEDVDGWSRWAHGFRTVARRDPSGALAVGDVADVEVRSVLPFTLRFPVEVTELAAPRSLGIRADGDLAGTGRWLLAPAGDGTSVVFLWDVGLTRRVLDVLGRLRVARRLLIWNHDRVMRTAGEGLVTCVRAEHASSRC